MSFLAAIPAALGGIAGAAGGLSTALGLVGTVISAVGSIAAGSAQAAAANQQAQAYTIQARQSLIEGTARSLEYKRQGVQVMEKVLQTQGTIRARAAAGGIDPFSGSAGALTDYAMEKGQDEIILATEGAEMAILAGQANSAGYLAAAAGARDAARSARTMGLINAAGTVVGGLAKAFSIGGAPAAARIGSVPSLATPLGPPIGPVSYTAFGFGRNV